MAYLTLLHQWEKMSPCKNLLGCFVSYLRSTMSRKCDMFFYFSLKSCNYCLHNMQGFCDYTKQAIWGMCSITDWVSVAKHQDITFYSIVLHCTCSALHSLEQGFITEGTTPLLNYKCEMLLFQGLERHNYPEFSAAWKALNFCAFYLRWTQTFCVAVYYIYTVYASFALLII